MGSTVKIRVLRQKETEATEDEMVMLYHPLNGHEFGHTLGDSGGQGSLACCQSMWLQRVRHNLVTEQLIVTHWLCFYLFDFAFIYLTLLFKCIKKYWSEVLVAQSCLTLCHPMDQGSPGFSVHGIFQARILEWVAISFSRGSSRPGDWTWVSCIAGRFFTVWTTKVALKKYWRTWKPTVTFERRIGHTIGQCKLSHWLLSLMCERVCEMFAVRSSAVWDSSAYLHSSLVGSCVSLWFPWIQ